MVDMIEFESTLKAYMKHMGYRNNPSNNYVPWIIEHISPKPILDFFFWEDTE